MVNLEWDGDDFRNSQDASGSTADLVSHSGKLQQGYQHGSLTRGLVAYYPMEKGEGEVLHDGALNNLGQINGASWNTETKYGSYSLYFDGTNSVSLNGSGIMDSKTRAFTSSAWIYIDSSISSRTNFFLIEESSGGGVMSFKMDVESDSSLRFQDDNNGFTAGSVPANQWTHIAIVANQSEVKGYIDGQEVQLKSSAWTQGTPDTSTAIISNEGHSKYIEEIRLFKKSLSKPEIKALASLTKPSGIERTENNVPSQDQAGISRYRLDGDVTDSWSSNDGTDNTSAGYSTGVYGQAKEFDGNDDDIKVSSTNELHFNDAFTVSTWYKWNGQDSNSTFLGVWDNINDEREWLFRINGDSTGDPYNFILSSDGTNITTYAANNAKTDKWIHVAGIYDGEKVFIYENGRQISSFSHSNMFNGNADLYIGSNNGRGAYFDGKIDDVRIYDTALTPLQVEKLYHKGAYRIPRRSTLQ